MSILESRISGFFSGGSGGGGLTSVQTDNLTIRGDGTIGSPLFGTGATYFDDNVQLNIGVNYTPYYYGTFIVKTFGADLFILPTSVWGNGLSVLDGQRITIINSNSLGNYANIDLGLSGGGAIKYQGTNFDVVSIPTGMTYEFIFDDGNNTWYCYNTTSIISIQVSIDTLGGTYGIPIAGCYELIDNTNGFGIELPDAFAFRGGKFIFINNYNGLIQYQGTPKFRPKRANGTVINTIPKGFTDTVVVDGTDTWRLVNRY